MEDNKGIVYVWIGKKADPDDARLAEEIANDMYGVRILTILKGFFILLLASVLLENSVRMQWWA